MTAEPTPQDQRIAATNDLAQLFADSEKMKELFKDGTDMPLSKEFLSNIRKIKNIQDNLPKLSITELVKKTSNLAEISEKGLSGINPAENEFLNNYATFVSRESVQSSLKHLKKTLNNPEKREEILDSVGKVILNAIKTEAEKSPAFYKEGLQKIQDLQTENSAQHSADKTEKKPSQLLSKLNQIGVAYQDVAQQSQINQKNTMEN